MLVPCAWYPIGSTQCTDVDGSHSSRLRTVDYKQAMVHRSGESNPTPQTQLDRQRSTLSVIRRVRPVFELLKGRREKKTLLVPLRQPLWTPLLRKKGIDDAALPAARREQVRRYFNELRKRFEAAN